MADTDEESNRSENEDSDENDDRRGNQTGRSGPQQTQNDPPPYSFDKAVEEMKRLDQDLRKHKSAKKNSSVKLSWVQIIPALEKEAEENGLSLENMNLIWKIAKSPKATCAIKHRCSLIQALIPERYLEDEIVEDICIWLVRAVTAGSLRWTSVFNCVLKYLYGVVEYSLTENDVVGQASIYRLLFTLHRRSELIESLCLLLKKVTSKVNVIPYNVKCAMDLKDKVHNPGQKRAIISLLRKYQTLRPDFFVVDVFRMQLGSSKSTKSSLPENFRKLLYAAKKRTAIASGLGQEDQDVENYDSHNIRNSKLFPDLAVQYDNYTIESAISKEADRQRVMMWAFVNTDAHVLFGLDPILLELLESWIHLHMLHKIPYASASDDERCEFFLEKCGDISIALGKGFHAMDDCLMRFMVTWDMVLWKKQILTLFSYLNLFDIAEFEPKYVLSSLGHNFLICPLEDAYELWVATEKLLLRWIRHLRKEFPAGQDGGEEVESATTLVRQLLDLMKVWVIKYIALHLADKGSEEMICRIMLTYVQLAEDVSKYGPIGLEPVPPMCVLYSIFVKKYLPAFEILAEFMLSARSWKVSLRRDGDAAETLSRMEEELERFFNNGLDKLPMSDLFAAEFAAYKNREPELDQFLETIDKSLRNITIDASKAFKLFRTQESRRTGNFVLDINELKQAVPKFAKYYSVLQKKTFAPPFASTPLNPRNPRD